MVWSLGGRLQGVPPSQEEWELQKDLARGPGTGAETGLSHPLVEDPW